MVGLMEAWVAAFENGHSGVGNHASRTGIYGVLKLISPVS